MPADITKVTHPKLFEAFETISHDGGARAGWSHYTVPDYWIVYVPIVEAALATLSEEELTIFAIGEEGEQQEITNRTPDLGRANALLAAFFDEDWDRG